MISSGPRAVGVEPADHLAAAGTRELVVRRRPAAEHLHPRPGDRDADDQAVALACRRRAVEGAGAATTAASEEEDEQDALHGSLPKTRAETAPAASSSNAPPAANAAVTSRSSLTLPIREPSSS